MTAQYSYLEGKLYSLEEIRSITSRLKMVANKKVPDLGTFYVYRDGSSDHYWIGGPLKGTDSNFFIYLGQQKAKDQLLQKLAQELMRNFDELSEADEEEITSDFLFEFLADLIWED